MFFCVCFERKNKDNGTDDEKIKFNFHFICFIIKEQTSKVGMNNLETIEVNGSKDES